jgi:hypothetical protein
VRTLFDERAQEIVPYLATVMALVLTGEHEQRVKFLDAQAMKRQVFSSTRQLAERVAQRQPVLIVLEDWHWASQEILDCARKHLLPFAERPIEPPQGSPPAPSRPSQPRGSRQPRRRTRVCGAMRDHTTPLAQEHARALIDNSSWGSAEAVRAQIQRRQGQPVLHRGRSCAP